MAIDLNTGYLSTNRGVIKIVQIIVGFILSTMLCQYWHGFECFNDGRSGYVSGVNYVVWILNIIWFILNLVNIKNYKLERTYAIVCTILYFIALAIMLWFIIDAHLYSYDITATVLTGAMAFLFLWDVKILQGESSNYSGL